jgi:hypothetical protein
MAGPGSLPPNYREVRYWKLTGNAWNFLAINLVSVACLVAFGIFFLWFAAQFGELRESTVGAGWIAGLVIGTVLTLVLHELTHGAAMSLFGARPKYGVLWKSLVAYATAPGHAFTRGQYLTVSLAPLVGLSVLAMVAMVSLAGSSLVWLLALCAALNAAGAGGDMWMSVIVLRCPPSAYIVDERDGMRIFLPA